MSVYYYYYLFPGFFFYVYTKSYNPKNPEGPTLQAPKTPPA